MEQITANYGDPMGGPQNIYDSEDAKWTISPLPPVLRHGLGAVATFGLFSFFTTLTLFVYLSYKIVIWQLMPVPLERPITPELDSPTISDVNGFLVPDSHLCPQMEEKDTAPQETIWERLLKEPPNQFLVLIYNLLFADIQQSLAFLLNVTWLSKDAVAVGTSQCWAQGWFVSTGDLASSVFISAIAAHTYLGVIKGYRLPTWAFYLAILSLWAFIYGLAILGVLITNNGQSTGGLYVRAGAWCWINPAYQNLRLTLHYLWIFLSLGFTSLVYLVIYIYLQIHSKHSRVGCLSAHGEHYPNPDPNGSTPTPSIPPMSPRSQMTDMSAKRLPPIPSSARHPTFLLYPIIYVLCTAPLAMGRIASMAGNNVSLGYFCFAGSMIACNGWMDVLLYSYTRRSIVFSGEAPPSQDTGIETFAFMRTPYGRRFGNVIYVAGGDQKCHETKRWRRWKGAVIDGTRLGSLRSEKNASADTLRGFGMGGGEVMGMAIQCETVTTVVVEVKNGEKHKDSQSTKGSVASMATMKTTRNH